METKQRVLQRITLDNILTWLRYDSREVCGDLASAHDHPICGFVEEIGRELNLKLKAEASNLHIEIQLDGELLFQIGSPDTDPTDPTAEEHYPLIQFGEWLAAFIGWADEFGEMYCIAVRPAMCIAFLEKFRNPPKPEVWMIAEDVLWTKDVGDYDLEGPAPMVLPTKGWFASEPEAQAVCDALNGDRRKQGLDESLDYVVLQIAAAI